MVHKAEYITVNSFDISTNLTSKLRNNSVKLSDNEYLVFVEYLNSVVVAGEEDVIQLKLLQTESKTNKFLILIL